MMLIMKDRYRIHTVFRSDDGKTGQGYTLEEYEIHMDEWCLYECRDDLLELLPEDAGRHENVRAKNGILYEYQEIWNSDVEMIAKMLVPLCTLASRKRFSKGLHNGISLITSPAVIMGHIENILCSYERQQLDLGQDYWLDDAIVRYYLKGDK